MNGSRAFLPDLLRAGERRRIVNIASLAGLVAVPNMSAYVAAKHAVVGLSESLCLELRLKGVQVGMMTMMPRHHQYPDHEGSRQRCRVGRRCAVPASHGVLREAGRHPTSSPAPVRAVRHERELVPVDPFATSLYYLRRCSRKLAQYLILQDARRAGYI